MMLVHKKSGQTSVEVIVILALLLGVLVMVLMATNTSLFSASAGFGQQQMSSALDEIVAASERVHHQGEGALTEVFVSFPSSYYNGTVNGKSIVLRHRVSGGSLQESYRSLGFNVTGSLPDESGRYRIRVQAQSDAVNVSY